MFTAPPRSSADGTSPADVILDNIPALVSTVTATGAIDFANRQLLEYVGVSLEELQDWATFIHESDRLSVMEEWTRSVSEVRPFDMEFRLRRSDGVYCWFHSHAVPVRAENGSVLRWYNLATDIEGRKRVDDPRHATERDLRAIVDDIPAMIAIHTESGELLLENRAAQEYHGRLPGETTPSETAAVVHPDDVPSFTAATRHALMTGLPLMLEQRLCGGDGAYRWFQVRSQRSGGRNGNGPRWYTVGTDIDDRRRAVEAARAAESDLRLVLDTLPALVKTMTPSGEIEFANQRLLDYLGVGLDQLQEWPRFIHESDRPMMIERLTRSLENGQPYEAECRLRRADGVYRWLQGSAVPVRGPDGDVVRWYYLIIDIEDRKQAEDLLRSSERQFRAIVDNIPALVGVITESGELEMVNRASLDFHGQSLDELKQWKVSDLVHPDDLPAELQALQHSFQTGLPLEHEHRLRRADAEYRWFQLRALRSRNEQDGTSRWYCVETDIHDRKIAEQALLASETRLLEVQQLSRTGAWRYDAGTGIVESSPEIQRVYGVQPGEDISHPSFWFERIHPDDRPRVQAHFERCLGERTDYQAGYRIVLPDGSIRYQYATGHPVTNEAGELVEFIGASMDMTDHWLATRELERASEAVRALEARMSRAAQIAAVGELAGSIAHEVNQPLAAVVANGHASLRWLSASPPNLPRAREAVERIVKDGKDAGEIVRRVRGLFRRTAPEKVPLRLDEVIGEVLRLLDSHPTRREVSISVVLSPDLPCVCADRVQLQQVLLNLMRNALEALEPVSGRAKLLSVRSERTDAGQAVILVGDNGIGFEDPAAAFEPFVTTKPDGMGLGLAICRSIIAAHDGTLSAERNAGFGMTFTLTLPISLDASV